LLRVGQVAALLSRSVRTIRRMDQAGSMPASVQVAGRRWVRREIEEWIADGLPELTYPLHYRRPYLGLSERPLMQLKTPLVAQLIATSVRTMPRLESSGRMPPATRHKGTRWNLHELEAWIDEGCPDLKNDPFRYRRKQTS
jgi:predicted DNA-binding transcriptional regulator AlpA